MDAPNNINKENFNNSYDNCNQGKGPCRSDFGRNPNEMNDNLSEKANSVQTSYKYKKNKKGPNTISSKDSNPNRYNNPQINEEDSIEMSDNDNLICPNCINYTLMEEKQRREELERQREKERNRMYDYGNDYNNALIDKNRNYDQNLIDEKRKQREYNTNEAIQNLAKINAGLSNKDKLIQLNENSRNPLNDGLPDYQYQKFQDEYQRRQKMINDNIDKYYPNMANERPEIKSYYDNYVYNPKYDGKRTNGYGYTNKYGESGRPGPYDTNKAQYIKDLEDQINYKNELKKREKEEERRRGQKQFEDMQKELKREDEERYLKEKRKQEELIRANNELIDQKNKMKLKDLEDKMRYRELCDRQNAEYKKDLQRQQLEKERMKDEIYNHNKNEQMRREKERELEREKEKEREMMEGKYGPGYGGKYGPGYGGKYDERYGPGGKYDERYGREGKYDERYGPGGKFDEKYGRDGKYGEKYGDKYGDKYGEKYGDKYGDKYGGKYDERGLDKKGDKYGTLGDNRYGRKDDDRYGKGDNRYEGLGIGKHKVKERMGRCCRCHRIFPRRLLTINRYFYKENRK